MSKQTVTLRYVERTTYASEELSFPIEDDAVVKIVEVRRIGPDIRYSFVVLTRS